MIHIPGLSDSMKRALSNIAYAYKPATASARALVRKGLATEADGVFILTDTGKLARRCIEARINRLEDFEKGDVVSHILWRISRDILAANVEVGRVIRRVKLNGEWDGRLEVSLPSRNVWVYPEDLLPSILGESIEQPVPAMHPVIAALRDLDVDSLDPIAALTKLYEFKRMAGA